MPRMRPPRLDPGWGVGAGVKLPELRPQFLRYTTEIRTWTQRNRDGSTTEVTGPQQIFVNVEAIGDADGIIFLCPKCFAANGGSLGTHSVVCWSPRVPPDADPKPGRWNLVGTSYADLSLRAGSSSVLLTGGCNAHFYVERGDIRMC